MTASYCTARRAQTTAARIAAALAVDVAAEGDDHGTAQERAIAGGLQEHSVGDIYPLAVVGFGNGDFTHYEVHDIQRGNRLGMQVGPGDHMVRKYRTAQSAMAAAEAHLNRTPNFFLFPSLWLPA